MTHGPAPCTGMVDEALKRPPAKLARTCRPGRRPPSRLLLEIDVGQRLPVVIADDEAVLAELGVRVVQASWDRREAPGPSPGSETSAMLHSIQQLPGSRACGPAE